MLNFESSKLKEVDSFSMIDLLLLVNDLLFVVEFDEFKTSWL